MSNKYLVVTWVPCLPDVTAQALSTAVPLDVPGTELVQLLAFLYYFL
jgi:hypothetical protein